MPKTELMYAMGRKWVVKKESRLDFFKGVFKELLKADDTEDVKCGHCFDPLTADEEEASATDEPCCYLCRAIAWEA